MRTIEVSFSAYNIRINPQKHLIDVATIVTHDYVYAALAMKASMDAMYKTKLHMLVTNSPIEEAQKLKDLQSDDICIDFIDDIANGELGVAIRAAVDKYHNKMDSLRWSLKSAYLYYIIKHRNAQKIFWCDCDLFFCGDYKFLVDMLDEHNVIITPHWRPSNCHANYIHGTYNAGFVGVNNKATDFLLWWFGECLRDCTDNTENGIFVDQKYLDMAPIYHDAHIIKHKGCNVATWNDHLHRELCDDGVYRIEGDPIVFVHFSGSPGINKFNGYMNTLYSKYCIGHKTQSIKLISDGLPGCSNINTKATTHYII